MIIHAGNLIQENTHIWIYPTACYFFLPEKWRRPNLHLANFPTCYPAEFVSSSANQMGVSIVSKKLGGGTLGPAPLGWGARLTPKHVPSTDVTLSNLVAPGQTVWAQVGSQNFKGTLEPSQGWSVANDPETYAVSQVYNRTKFCCSIVQTVSLRRYRGSQIVLGTLWPASCDRGATVPLEIRSCPMCFTSQFVALCQSV